MIVDDVTHPHDQYWVIVMKSGKVVKYPMAEVATIGTDTSTLVLYRKYMVDVCDMSGVDASDFSNSNVRLPEVLRLRTAVYFALKNTTDMSDSEICRKMGLSRDSLSTWRKAIVKSLETKGGSQWESLNLCWAVFNNNQPVPLPTTPRY